MNNRRRYYRRAYRPKRRNKAGALRSILLTLLIFFGLVAIIISLPVNHAPKESLAGSVYVIDGDTVILNKVHIRLLGMDAPEMGQSCRLANRDYLCGVEARKALLAKINGAAIRCDKEGIDKYGRDLGRCYLGTTDLNQWMVEQGWAVSYGGYKSEEATARRDKRGIWAGSFEVPYQWRKDHQKPNAEPETGHETPSLGLIGDVVHYIRNLIFGLLNEI